MTPTRQPIAFLIPTLDTGGAERKTVALANRLVQRGWDVDICTLFQADGPYRAEVDARVRIIDFRARRWRLMRRVRRYVRQERPRLLVGVMHSAASYSVLAAAGTRTPTVMLEGGLDLTMLRDAGFPIRYRTHIARIRLLYARVACIIANTPAIIAELADHTGIDPARCRVIANPSALAVLDDPQPPHEREAGIAPVVITVARLDANKDVATLLRAFAAVRAKRPASLAIIGQGPEREMLEALAATLGIAADTRFFGAVAAPWRTIRGAAVYVNSSRTEGFSNALIEAMAVGCPIVATDAPGGNRAILDDGRYGALVPVGDPQAMAAAIDAMLDRPTDRDALVARAALYGEAQVDAYEEVFTAFARPA